MGQTIQVFFQWLNHTFTYNGFSFTLLEVVYCDLLLTAFGLFIKHIILFGVPNAFGQD